MEPEHYAKLPRTLKVINITGGEPFLRKDLVEIVRQIHLRAPSARIVFSTNGLLTDTIATSVSEIRKFHKLVGVGVSIDGLEKTHDRIRGVDGTFKRAVSTIERLKKIGIRDLRIGMTLLPDNVDEAKRVFDLSRQLGIEFTVTFAHNSQIYFQKTDNPSLHANDLAIQSLTDVLRAQLLSTHPKDWFRAYHIRGLIDSEIRREFIQKCKAGSRYFFMSPSGNVFPCMVMDNPMGNLGDAESWNGVFRGDVEERTLRAVSECRQDCWMVCNTRSLVLTHPLKAGSGVVANKIRAMLKESKST